MKTFILYNAVFFVGRVLILWSLLVCSNHPFLLGQVLEPLQLQKEVEQALSSHEDDPCYSALFQQEVARRVTGQELPWVQFSPVELHFEWNVQEEWTRGRGFSSDKINYTLTEDAAGCQIITYDQKTRQKLQTLSIHGPHLYTDSDGMLRPGGSFNRNITQINAGFLACRLDGTKCRPYSTSHPEHFRFKSEEYPAFGLVYEEDIMGSGMVYQHQLTASSSCFEPITEKIVIDSDRQFRSDLPLCIVTPQEVLLEGKQGFTLNAWKQGMQQGEWILTYPLKYSYQIPGTPEGYLREGTVKIRIVFNPGSMEVSPNEKWVINGPDPDKKFHNETQIYKIQNNGGAAIRYKVTTDAPWLSIDQAEGELMAEKGASVKLALNQVGKELEHGIYKGWITFTNTTNGAGNTKREVVLEVEEEQLWRLTLSGFELDGGEEKVYVYEKVLLGTEQKVYIASKGARFDHKQIVDFIVKKKKGKWTWKSGVVTFSDVKAGNNYDPSLYQVFYIRCVDCGNVSGLKGHPISGSVHDNHVTVGWSSRMQTKADVEYKIKLGCRNYENPKGDCDVGKTKFQRRVVAAEFFNRAGSHQIPLNDKKVLDFPVKAPGDKMPWIKHHYFVERIK